MFDADTTLGGASGGGFALIGAHLAVIVTVSTVQCTFRRQLALLKSPIVIT